MFEKLKHWLGLISSHDMTTPRVCLSSFLRALEKCDTDNNGKINLKEFIILFKELTIKSVTSYEMSDTEIDAYLETFKKKW